MNISAIGLGKKFDRNWIFRDISFQIESGERVAITGRNGSGKSTLLRILTGSLSPTSGSVLFKKNDEPVEPETLFQAINFCAPYVELPEEFSLNELLHFHAQFKQPIVPIAQQIERMGYPEAANKRVGQYSSGMKQRVRLALALFFEADVLAFDEPTTNLDEVGVAWYLHEMAEISANKTILISSNQRYEYDFCKKSIELSPQ